MIEILATAATTAIFILAAEHLARRRKPEPIVVNVPEPAPAVVLTLDDYQKAAQRTANSPLPFQTRRMVAALGLVGEGGEVAEIIKKAAGHGHKLDTDKVAKELGDVLWYVAELAALHGLRLSHVAALNVEKLRKRYPDGFTSEASQARVDVHEGHPIGVLAPGCPACQPAYDALIKANPLVVDAEKRICTWGICLNEAAEGDPLCDRCQERRSRKVGLAVETSGDRLAGVALTNNPSNPHARIVDAMDAGQVAALQAMIANEPSTLSDTFRGILVDSSPHHHVDHAPAYDHGTTWSDTASSSFDTGSASNGEGF